MLVPLDVIPAYGATVPLYVIPGFPYVILESLYVIPGLPYVTPARSYDTSACARCYPEKVKVNGLKVL
jgi:hypothetical protein